MCEKVGGPCVCRLALSLSRMHRLSVLDLSNNNLDRLPDAVFGVPEAAEQSAGVSAGSAGLGVLLLRGNRLCALPAAAGTGAAAKTLQLVDLRHNKFSKAAALEPLLRAGLSSEGRLSKLLLAGNPICSDPAQLDALRQLVAELQEIRAAQPCLSASNVSSTPFELDAGYTGDVDTSVYTSESEARIAQSTLVSS